MSETRLASPRLPPALESLVLALFAFGVAFGLVLPRALSGAYILLGLVGIVYLSMTRSWTRPALPRDGRLWIFAALAFILVALVAWFAGDMTYLGWRKIGRLLRFLLVVPIFILFLRVSGVDRVLWPSLVVGACTAAAYALWFSLTGQVGDFGTRVGGSTNPIYFGGIALAFAVMLPGWLMSGHSNGLRVGLVLLGATAGLVAATLSGTRGAWLALPPLLLCLAFLPVHHLERRVRLGMPVGAMVLAIAVLAWPGSPVAERLWEGARGLQQVLAGETVGGTLGLRLEMWALALQEYLAHPLLGAGPGGYRLAIESAVAAGVMDPLYLEFKHPHNEMLSVAASRGTLGLIALALLFLVPMRQFLRAVREPDSRVAGPAWAAATLVITVLAMAFTEAVFDRNVGVTWFALFTTVGAASLIRLRAERLAEAPGPRRYRLSAILITRDEADRVRPCLESLVGWVDEIVVLDSGSVDATVAICHEYTDRVSVTDWPGYGVQKQRALEAAGGDWILSVDADERVSAGLRREIDHLLAGEPLREGYALPWETYAFGTRLDFGRWGRAPLRLFRKEGASFTDSSVHETVVLPSGNRAKGRLHQALVHETYRDYGHALEKFGQYAWLQAKERHAAGRRASLVGALLRGMVSFLDNYLLKLGILDGRVGLIMSMLYAQYTYNKYAGLWLLGRPEGRARE